jgi:zinc transporter ZupT
VFSKSKAIQIQFTTSIAAFIGTIVGLLSDGHQLWQDVMLAVTAGGFIYVACVSLIPTVLATTPHSHTHTHSPSPPPSPSPVAERTRAKQRAADQEVDLARQMGGQGRPKLQVSQRLM